MSNKATTKNVKLVFRLKAKGWKKARIARRVGVHVDTVTAWLNKNYSTPDTISESDVAPCEPWYCGECKATVYTPTCVACRARAWKADRK